MRGAGTTVIMLLTVCCGQSLELSSDPLGVCAKATNLCNATPENIKGDWLILYSSTIKTRNGASYYGGDWPYDFCDPLNLNSGCMAVGYSILPVNSSKQVGYAYSFNAFTDTWTIEQFTNIVYNVPGTNLVKFRTNFNHYIQVENSAIFSNGTAVPCNGKVVRSGPIYRSANFVILAAAPDFSWVLLLYCDNYYGFVDNNAPLIQLVVKRDIIDKCSYPLNTLYFYTEVKAALIANRMNIYGSDFKLIYHDVGGLYPAPVSWTSIQWEADCVCQNY